MPEFVILRGGDDGELITCQKLHPEKICGSYDLVSDVTCCPIAHEPIYIAPSAGGSIRQYSGDPTACEEGWLYESNNIKANPKVCLSMEGEGETTPYLYVVSAIEEDGVYNLYTVKLDAAGVLVTSTAYEMTTNDETLHDVCTDGTSIYILLQTSSGYYHNLLILNSSCIVTASANKREAYKINYIPGFGVYIFTTYPNPRVVRINPSTGADLYYLDFTTYKKPYDIIDSNSYLFVTTSYDAYHDTYLYKLADSGSAITEVWNVELYNSPNLLAAIAKGPDGHLWLGGSKGSGYFTLSKYRYTDGVKIDTGGVWGATYKLQIDTNGLFYYWLVSPYNLFRTLKPESLEDPITGCKNCCFTYGSISDWTIVPYR